jgi:O-antigen biosynthesis protein
MIAKRLRTDAGVSAKLQNHLVHLAASNRSDISACQAGHLTLVQVTGRERAVGTSALSPNVTLALHRIAQLLGVSRAGVFGRPAGELAAALAPGLDLVEAAGGGRAARAASRDGLAIVLGCAPNAWPECSEARVMVAIDLDPQGDELDALEDMVQAARRVGWRIPYSGLLHTTGADDSQYAHPIVIACQPTDDAAYEALDNGPLSIALDPEVNDPEAKQHAREGRPARVLIASYEIAGPTGNGGIGTAYHSLAHTLAAAGHIVTVLFTGWIDPEQGRREEEWRRSFADAGIVFAFLGTPWYSPVRSPHHAVRRAYELHYWLSKAHAENPFDVVHIPECLGHGALVITAKILGLAYHGVEFVVGTHSSTRWVAESNREGIENVEELVTEWLERLSVERADVVMSPTAYLIDYMRDRGWRLPKRTFVQQNAVPHSTRSGADRDASQGPSELVFFGRLETRKGLEAFCDALDLLSREPGFPLTRVTFLGRPEKIMGEDATDFVFRRARSWGFDCQVLPDLGHDEAIAYLSARKCVLVMPSLVDNAPNTVREAVALGIPFIASRSGGIPELIASADLASSTFDGWSHGATLQPPALADQQDPFDTHALAEAISIKLGDWAGVVSPAIEDVACDRAYDRWHRALAARKCTRPAYRALPTVGVCIVAQDPVRVSQIADALAGGTVEPDGLIVVCPPDPEGAAGAVRVVEATGRGVSAARSQAVAELDADVVLVLHDDTQPDAQLVERVRAAMAVDAADVLSLVMRDPDRKRPTGLDPSLAIQPVPADLFAFVPVGGPAVAAVVYPAFAVGPYAIRREALAELGGYADDLWGDALDDELLARASLVGLRIDVLPEALATAVRDDRWTTMRSHHWGDAPVPVYEGEQQIRLLRPFRRRIEEPLADLPALLAGTVRAAGDVARQRLEDRRDRQELVDVYEGRVAEYLALVDSYESRLEEQRELIALYEQQKQEIGEVYEAQLSQHRELLALYDWRRVKTRLKRWGAALLRRVRRPR